MKKISLLLFIGLALNCITYAQTPKIAQNLIERLATSRPQNSRFNLAYSYLKNRLKYPIKSAIAINDSTYYWRSDGVNNNGIVLEKTIYTYNNYNNVATSVHSYWNGLVWINYEKAIYDYDINNNVRNTLYQNWNGTIWVNSKQYIYTYDAANNKTSSLLQDWDNNTWVNYTKEFFTYDANKNQKSYLAQNWENNIWVNRSQISYSYNSANKLANELIALWNGTVWVDLERFVHTYDANGYNTDLTLQYYADSSWINLTHVGYAYDKSDLKSLTIQLWEADSWENSVHIYFAYDTNNNLTSDLLQLWSESKWVNEDLYLNTYDNKNNLTSVTYKLWDDEAAFKTADSTHYYYHSKTANLKKLTGENTNVAIYPNPFLLNTMIAFDAEQRNSTVKIMDIMGRELRTINFTGKQLLIEKGNMKPGIYFVQITDAAKNVTVKKIIVE